MPFIGKKTEQASGPRAARRSVKLWDSVDRQIDKAMTKINPLIAPNRWMWPSTVGALAMVLVYNSSFFMPMRLEIERATHYNAATLLSAIGLGLEEVKIENDSVLSEAEIKEFMEIAEIESILLLDGDLVRERLESHPRIRRASVQKLLPNGLRVTIEARQPFAYWQKDQQYKIIDREGFVISDRVRVSDGVLPQIVGEGAPDRAAELLDLVKTSPEVSESFLVGVYVGNRRWNITLKSKTEVLLPAFGLEKAIKDLGFILANGEIERLKPARLDLRLTDRIVISPNPGGGSTS